MVRLGMEVRSRTDYIMGKYFCLFRNVDFREPQHNSDYYMVLGCLCSTPLGEHTKYRGQSTRLPLWPPTTPTREDGIFADLWIVISKPKAWEARKNVWILADTWRLVNKRVSAR